MIQKSKLKNPVQIWVVIAFLMVFWCVCILSFFLWDLRHWQSAREDVARTAARISFLKDLGYRDWMSRNGPIYVPMSDSVPPSPYMPKELQKVSTRTGKILTVIHPSQITRQVNEVESQDLGIHSRLTSLEPLRDGNTPDFWERAALESLAKGAEEVTGVSSQGEREYMRLMHPLQNENSCGECHAQTGMGKEFRGGISISVPMDLFAGSARKHLLESATRHSLILVLGIAGLGLAGWYLQRQVERRRQEEEHLRSIFIHSGAGMSKLDERGRFLEVNDAFCGMLGYPAEKFLTLSATEITHPNDSSMTERMLEEVRSGKRKTYRYEKRLRREDGSNVWIDVSTSWFKHGNSPLWGIAISQDITDRKRAVELAEENKERLEYLANHDALTHLPNRRLLEMRLKEALARARRHECIVAVLFLDLDHFKTINDTLGHELGDRLICAAAVRLRSMLRVTDTLARFGGDEFVIVLDQMESSADVARVAQKILKAFEEPFILGEHHLHVSMSIGISLFPGDGQDLQTLLQCADLAMYNAKEKGRNTAEFCTPELNNRTRERLLMEGALRQSVQKSELVLHYQPQVHVASGEVVGMEALLRWQHPLRGMVSPGDFIPLAEETGLIIRMGEWVLWTACKQAKSWIDQGFPPVRMAVNISARQFREGNLVATVEKILRETGLPPDLLELELTESMVMGEVKAAIGIMEEFTRLGVRLAIDDFGSGYSSLKYLKQFPITTLKIDQSFVNDFNDSRTASIVDTIIHVSDRLGLEVIAEGIETEEQRNWLHEIGCQTGQGFLFSRPLPAKDMQPILENQIEMVR